MPSAPARVTIVGAGLAGLSCAVYLHRAGVTPVVLEASDRAGGRVATDELHGFRLDRGFQVYNTAYIEGRRLLNLDALELRSFTPGALVWRERKTHRLSDPLRDPRHALAAMLSPLATFSDKLRVLKLIRDVRSAGDPTELYAQTNVDARAVAVVRLLRPVH
ncbi:MAG: FAD-dependent oxidoreductase [Tepidisphaeraceae bacterium]